MFIAYPLYYSIILAVKQTFGPKRSMFVGLDNFRFLAADPLFRKAVWNTTVFAAGSVLIQLPVSLGLALLLNRPDVRGRAIFRLIFFSPSLVGLVFVAMMFSLIFEKNTGLVNVMLHSIYPGFDPEFPWLQQYVMPTLIIAALWMYAGFNMIYFLAALQNVSKTLVEAAWIDGAGPWGVFWNVTRLAVMPVATFVVVVSTIGSFQLFELPFILLEGYGPKNSGMTIVGYLYNNAFENGDLGTAAAVGWLLTLIILSISLVQIKLSGTMENDR